MGKTAAVEYSLTLDSNQAEDKAERMGSIFDKVGQSGERSFQRCGQGIDSLFGRVISLNNAVELAERAFHLLSLPMEKIITVGSKFEDIQLQLETVLGSASEAQKYFEWIKNFANTTPFKMEGLTEAVIMLESFGIKGQEYLRTFGDVAAGLKVPLNDLSRIMGQIYAKPTAQAEEMLQLIERGIPVQRILQKELGLTAAQVGNIGREGIEGQKVFEALARGMQDMYGGAMEKMSRNMSGLLSTLSDKVELFLGRIAGPVLESLKGKLNDLLENIDRWAADGTLERWGENIAEMIIGLIDTIATFTQFLIDVGKAIKFIVDLAGGLETVAATLAIVFAVGKIQAFTSAMAGTSAAFAALSGSVTGSNLLLTVHIGLTKAASAAWALMQKALPLIALAAAVKVFTEINSKLKELSRVHDLVIASDMRHNEQVNKNIKKLQEMRDGLGLTGKEMQTLRRKARDTWGEFSDRGIESARVIKLFQDGLVSADLKKRFDEWRESQEKLKKNTEVLKGKVTDLSKEIDKYRQSLKLVNLAGVEKEARLLIGALSEKEEQLFSSEAAFSAVSKKVVEIIGNYEALGKKAPEEIQKLWESIQIAVKLQEKQNEFTKEADKTFKILAGSLDTDIVVMKEFRENTDVTTSSMAAASEMTISWADKLIRLGETAFSVFGVISQGSDILERFGIISKGTAATLNSAINSIAGGIGQMTQGLEGIFFGSGNIFQTIQSGLSLISGAGSIIAGIAKGIASLFTGDGVGEAIDREREMIDITEEMEEKIRSLEEVVGDTHAATSMLMNEIIATANVNLQNFGNYAQRTRDILADLDRGTLSISETQAAIGKAFNELIDHAERLGTEGSKKMIELISDVRSRGLEVAEIWNYSNQKIMQGVDALETYLNTFRDTGEIQQEILDIQKQLTAGNLEAEEALRLQEQLIQKHDELFRVSGDIAQNWEFLQSSTASLFHSLESQGYGFVEIVRMMGSHFDTIATMAANTGLQVSEGLQAMLNMSEFIRQHEDLADRIEATRKMMEGLGDSAFMTQGDFTNFSEQTRLQFEEIMKLTGDEEMALRLIAPALQDLNKYREAYGFTIDANTKKLIENAQKEGMLQEETMTGQDKIVHLLEAITVKLGADIPYALQGLTGQVTDSLDRIAIKTGFWEGSLDDVQDKMVSIMGTMDDLDAQNTRIISGNTITEQVRLWWDSLDEVEKKYYEGLYGGLYNFHDNHGIVMSTISDQVRNQWLVELERIEAEMRYAQPDAMEVLLQKYDWIMQQMANSTQTLYLSQDGVLRTYYEMLQMNAQIQDFDFSSFGIFSDQQMEDVTTKYLAMKDAFEKNQDRILSDPDWANSFLRQLNGLKGGMVDDVMNKDYLAFLGMVRKEIQKDLIMSPDSNIGKEDNAGDEEPGSNSPGPRSRRPTYTPRTPQSQAADAANVGNVRIYNLYFPMGTTTQMKYDFKEMFLEILGDNPDGFSKRVSVILKEYE